MRNFLARRRSGIWVVEIPGVGTGAGLSFLSAYARAMSPAMASPFLRY